jgi:membrane-associated protease RseP (regulator of RpoE activity)
LDYYQQFLLGFAVFWAALYLLGRLEPLKKRGLDVRPFYFMFKVSNVNAFFDRFIKYRRAVKVLSDLGIAAGVFLTAYALWFFLDNLLKFQFAPSEFQGVTLVIPFVTIQTSTLLVYFFASVPIILVVHEFSHAIAARYEGISLKSGGIALLAVLIAGFVEPDEKEFKAAKPKQRIRVLAAGSWSNIILAAIVGALLIFQPMFAIWMPVPFRSAFYGPSSGVMITNFYSDRGLQLTGATIGDVVEAVNGEPVYSLQDLDALTIPVNTTIPVQMLMKGTAKTVQVTTFPNPNNSSRGALGFYGETYYPPHVNVPMMPFWLFSFLLWLSYFSAVVGAFNMLPMYPFDGEGYINSILESFVPAGLTKYIRYSINGFALALFAGNLIATALRVGFRPF